MPAQPLFPGRCFLLALPLLLALTAGAQTPQPPSQQPSVPVSANVSPADAGVVGDQAVPHTPEELTAGAWTMLSNAAGDAKHTDTQIQALGALGFMGSTPRAVKLIEAAMLSPDVDVRTASVLAAGQTRSALLTTDLRKLLDDREAQVVYTAALTLWKLNDDSGEDILMAVADGERSAAAGRVEGAKHEMSRDLHHPSTLARLGATQGAGMLLGPFGMGLTAYEYLHKNGGDTARVQALEAIAQNHTAPIRAELVAALGDKDLGVRAAAAKGLSAWHDPAAATAISQLFADPKPPVRLTAAATYLICTGAAVASPDPNARQSVTGATSSARPRQRRK